MVEKDISFEERVKILKSYIQRVTDGEDLEKVQADFKENFEHVPAKLIAKAEQQMMADGAKIEDIQKLCDIHSVLFHDMTDQERRQRLKEEMEAHQINCADEKIENVDDKISEKTIEYKNTLGHPLNILTIENDAIKAKIDSIKKILCESDDIEVVWDEIDELTNIRQHYAKKDDLLFPLLKDQYNLPGPADVMWGVEDEIRSQLHSIDNKEDLMSVLKRIEEMIYKEENILFPLCAENFTEDEWIRIADDMPMFGPCLVSELPEWDNRFKRNDKVEFKDDIVSLPGGLLTLKQLRAILNIIPMELTIIDENDINRFFDEDGNKVFLRPKMALNRDMHSCHPSNVLKMVDKLLIDFKNGKKNSMHVLSVVDGKQVLTNYYALRNDDGEYLGTMEAVLHIDGIIDCTSKNMKGPISPERIFPN